MIYVTNILAIYGFFELMFKILKQIIFKENLKFHEILKSFPHSSNIKRDKDVKKDTNKDLTYLKFSKEYSKIVNFSKMDEFILKLEKINTSKLFIYKRNKIIKFINNIIRIYGKENTLIENKTHRELTTKSIEFGEFNYYVINDIMNDNEKLNKLFICKPLKF